MGSSFGETCVVGPGISPQAVEVPLARVRVLPDDPVLLTRRTVEVPTCAARSLDRLEHRRGSRGSL